MGGQLFERVFRVRSSRPEFQPKGDSVIRKRATVDAECIVAHLYRNLILSTFFSVGTPDSRAVDG
jgi:hypothetical protein